MSDLPKGARRTSAGRITITFEVESEGRTRRLSQHSVTKELGAAREPRSYADAGEAWAGYKRVCDYLATKAPETSTLRAFWTRWTDPEDWYWGNRPKRSEQSQRAYAQGTRLFVERYGDREISSITEADVARYMSKDGVRSQLKMIALLFADAAREGLIGVHPCKDLARETEASLRDERKTRQRHRRIPKRPAVDAMLMRAADPVYPFSLHGWLTYAVETGARGGEIDGAEWEFYDAEKGIYRIDWQWHHLLKRMSPPKHNSHRTIPLSDRAVEAIEAQRGRDERFIFTNNAHEHWTHATRETWWTWNNDGGPSLRQLVEGATMYNATRHHWATHMLNVEGMSPYLASKLFGHKDGGRLMIETYADPDESEAIEQARAIYARRPNNVVDLKSRRSS